MEILANVSETMYLRKGQRQTVEGYQFERFIKLVGMFEDGFESRGEFGVTRYGGRPGSS